jgi:allophanate hydrolase
MIGLVVVGAHMRGLPLNDDLVSCGGVFRGAVETAPCYRLFLLPGGPPLRPGLLRVADGGARIAAELWALPAEGFGLLVASVPAPLCIGTVLLADGGAEKGFLAEAAGVAGAEDITRFGGWRGFLAARAAA